jgi:hypothetical protein
MRGMTASSVERRASSVERRWTGTAGQEQTKSDGKMVEEEKIECTANECQ